MTAAHLAPDTTALWSRSATSLAESIRSGEVSSRAVVQACLDRVADVNPAVNAATVVFTEQALQAADDADRAVRSGAELGPLHGVPISVKENVDLAWSATTHGLALFKDAIPDSDAVDVRRLREAGAIPLIRTNMPDMGMRWHTDNALHGATVNPWDPARTPGGSSGGEGVAVATGMTPLGLGNDYGGSIRLPAHANGVCGLKPTPGRIPLWRPGPGVFPLTAQLFSVEGPLGRTVDDVALGYEIMRGPCEIDPLTVPVAKDPYAGAPRRVAVVTDPGGLGTAPRITAAVRRAADALADAGWEVEEVEPPHIAEAALLWRELVVADLLEFLFNPAAGLVEHFSDGARDYTDQFVAHTRRLTLGDFGAAVSRRNEIRSAWSSFQASHPVILAPVITELPFAVGADLAGPDAVDEICHAHRLLVAVSCLGMPALALPVGTQSEAMPDGVQLIGPLFGEALCVAAGRELERACGAMTPIDPRPAR
ncbi:amidase [Jatrophihabitans telluris]|uniref:Amidase n=1 Tax=Jatrophihabitans telluris TaxID=2038343 RepID=A0ABY4R1K4_9ACTN|nr:amidase [Jatrophihabitans telluris]UQX89010.1 amidase [Jatrophihabitans telluris]